MATHKPNPQTSGANGKQNFPDNVLYEMDNLDVLRGMNSETVDLIATDPPSTPRGIALARQAST